MSILYDKIDPEDRDGVRADIELLRARILNAVKAHPELTPIQGDYAGDATHCCPMTIVAYDKIKYHLDHTDADDCDVCDYDSIGEQVLENASNVLGMDTNVLHVFIDGWDSYPKSYADFRRKHGVTYYEPQDIPFHVLGRELAQKLLGRRPQ
jgi:hypothetical protein